MTPEQIDQIVKEAMLRAAEALNPEGMSTGYVHEDGPPGRS